MKKLMKKPLNFILVLLILFNISISYYVPRTNSKYIKEGSLSFDAGFYQVKNDFAVTFKSVDVEGDNTYVTYNISFSRNSMLYSGEEDEYIVYARVNDTANTCRLSPSYTTPSSDSGTAKKSFLETSDFTKFNFVATCDITNFTGIVSIHFRAEETIASKTIVLGDVTKNYNNNNLFNKILDDIRNSSDFDDYDSDLRIYMESYFGTVFVSLSDMYEGKTLDGLTYSVDEYTYSFDDYYMGYAITNSANKEISSGIFRFAFSTTTNIDEVFKYYLKLYLGYSDSYISYIEDFMLEKTNTTTLEEALLEIINNNNRNATGIFKSVSPLVSQISEISFNENIVPNIINIKYDLDNKFKIPTNMTESSARAFYDAFISYFNYSELASNTFIKNEFFNLSDNESNLFIIDDSDSSGNSVKLLINIYKVVENDITYHKLSVTPLVSEASISIVNDSTLNYYDLVNDPSGSTVISASEYDEADTLEIINSIGQYTFGSTYNKTLNDLGISDITSTISYTLTNE